MQQKTAQTDICTKKKRGVTFRERGFIIEEKFIKGGSGGPKLKKLKKMGV